MPNTEEYTEVVNDIGDLEEATKKLHAMRGSTDIANGKLTLTYAAKAVKEVSSLETTENIADKIVEEFIKELENERAQLLTKSTTTQSNLFFKEATRENQGANQEVNQKVTEDSENTPSSLGVK